MNIIQEQRNSIIDTANTAQERIIHILESLNKRNDELTIREPLSGDVDLSILSTEGFGAIKKIQFAKGDITSITNIPNGVEHLECNDNLLVSIENLPGSLLSLKIDHNYLTTIDVSYLKQLELLHISHNKLTVIENLPPSLVEIRCENNELERMNLYGLVNLKTLYISNNRITLVENLPTEIVDFRMENTPTIEFRNVEHIPGTNQDAEEKKRKNQAYNDALQEYYRIKNKYEKDEHTLKRKVYERAPTKQMARHAVKTVQMPCIKCKRKVGTIFSTTANKHMALCGDSQNPCPLNIQIFRGLVVNYEDYLNSFKESSQTLHEAIIRQKLDALFSYIDEDESLKIYKNELEAYNIDSGVYKELLDFHNNLYNNEQKMMSAEKKSGEIFRLIEQSRALIDEYEQTGNNELLKLAMEIQVQQIIPETRNLRMIKHEIMETNPTEISYNKTQHVLFQYPTRLSNLDFQMDEPPRVIQFVR